MYANVMSENSVSESYDCILYNEMFSHCYISVSLSSFSCLNASLDYLLCYAIKKNTIKKNTLSTTNNYGKH